MAHVQTLSTLLRTYDNISKPGFSWRSRVFYFAGNKLFSTKKGNLVPLFYSVMLVAWTAMSSVLVTKQKNKAAKAVTSEKAVYRNSQVVVRKRIDK